MIEAIPYPRFEKRLPVVLSQTEVDALLRAVKNLKHRTLLTTIYATGLRVSEVTNLLITDIDSSRMIIQVRQGKGRKDRFVMLSPNLLTLLREYWKSLSSQALAVPRTEPKAPDQQRHCVPDLSAGSSGGQPVEVYFPAYAAPFVCDASSGSGH